MYMIIKKSYKTRWKSQLEKNQMKWSDSYFLENWFDFTFFTFYINV